MTQTPADIGLTPDAEARLEGYLHQVRAALVGVPDVSPDEIEADIREHVENELRTAVRPVALFVLESVLNRLGPPTQWLPAGRTSSPLAEVPSLGRYLRARLRGIGNALWRGPEDWRLPYLSFGVFAFGVLAFPLFPLFLIVSYLLARAGVAVAKEKGIELGVARKWLLYPPTLIVSLVLFLTLVVAVPIGMTRVGFLVVDDADTQERWELAGRPRMQSSSHFGRARELRAKFPRVETTLDKLLADFPGSESTREVTAGVFVGVGVVAFWWAILGFIAGMMPRAIRATFYPLCQRFEGRFAHRAGLVCLLVIAIWCGLAYRIITDAGLL